MSSGRMRVKDFIDLVLELRGAQNALATNLSQGTHRRMLVNREADLRRLVDQWLEDWPQQSKQWDTWQKGEARHE